MPDVENDYEDESTYHCIFGDCVFSSSNQRLLLDHELSVHLEYAKDDCGRNVKEAGKLISFSSDDGQWRCPCGHGGADKEEMIGHVIQCQTEAMIQVKCPHCPFQGAHPSMVSSHYKVKYDLLCNYINLNCVCCHSRLNI